VQYAEPVAGSIKTPKARALGDALAEARRNRKLSQRELAAIIGCSPGTIARWETGARVPQSGDIQKILTELTVSSEKQDQIFALAQSSDQPGWLATTLPEQRAQLDALVGFERKATKIINVEPLMIPGVLQTGEFIHAVMTTGGVPPDEIATRTAVRIGRRDVITRRNPARLLAIIGEPALRQVIGNYQIMATQLKYLLELVELPNIDVRVIPFTAGYHLALEGSFMIIESADNNPVVHLELHNNGLFFHEAKDINLYRRLTDDALAAAMSPDGSRALIASAINEMEAHVNTG
jgi:transcriptional regulator with XRE-family HTH domain